MSKFSSPFMAKSPINNKKNSFLKNVYDVGSMFLKGPLGVATAMLTPTTAYARGREMPDFIEGGVDTRSLEELERDGPLPLPTKPTKPNDDSENFK